MNKFIKNLTDIFLMLSGKFEPDWESLLVEQYKEKGIAHEDQELLEIIQYHEAGHAVVGSVYGHIGLLLLISTLRYPDCRGITLWEENDKTAEFQNLTTADKLQVLVYSAAGEEAEKIKYGQHHRSNGFGHPDLPREDSVNSVNNDSWKADADIIQERIEIMLAHDYGIQKVDPEYERFVRQSVEQARAIAQSTLLNHWAAVEEIVQRNKQEPVLGGTQVRAIIQRHSNTHPKAQPVSENL